jgi:hypothetical protein
MAVTKQQREDAIRRSNEYAVSIGGTSSATGGSVAPGGSIDPLRYGAGGRGESSVEDAKVAEEASRLGVPGSETGNFANDPNYQISSSKRAAILSPAQEKAFSAQSGLSGGYVDYKGLTRSEALSKEKQIKDVLGSQSSALTSGYLDPNSLFKVKQKFSDFKLSLDSITNDPWFSPQEKAQNSKSLTESFASEIAKGFNTQQEFNAAMQDPNVRDTLDQYEQMGGDVNNIGAEIGKKQQSTGDYLSQLLGPLDTPGKEAAFDSLIPQQQLAQDEIASLNNISEEYMDRYFGTEDQIGFLEREEKLALEEIKLIEKEAKLDEKNARAQVNLAISKADAEGRVASNKIEQNRLAAKNYMTGALAKLGALKTTGAAPQALGILEQRYQEQAQELQSSLQNTNRALELRLTEEVDSIGIEKDNDILNIKGDLSKSEEDIWNEVSKLQNNASSKTFDILGTYVKSFKSETDKYEKEAKSAAEKYAKSFAKTASDVDFNNLSFSKFISSKENQSLQSLSGNTRQGLVPEYIQGLVGNKNVSTELRDVLEGDTTLDDYTATVKTKIRKEMDRLDIQPDMLPKIEEEDKFGEISTSDETKGINYLLSQGASEEDIQAFKTDRSYQALILEELEG